MLKATEPTGVAPSEQPKHCRRRAHCYRAWRSRCCSRRHTAAIWNCTASGTDTGGRPRSRPAGVVALLRMAGVILAGPLIQQAGRSYYERQLRGHRRASRTRGLFLCALCGKQVGETLPALTRATKRNNLPLLPARCVPTGGAGGRREITSRPAHHHVVGRWRGQFRRTRPLLDGLCGIAGVSRRRGRLVLGRA